MILEKRINSPPHICFLSLIEAIMLGLSTFSKIVAISPASHTSIFHSEVSNCVNQAPTFSPCENETENVLRIRNRRFLTLLPSCHVNTGRFFRVFSFEPSETFISGRKC